MLDLAGIDGIALVVARTVLDEGDQVGVMGHACWFFRGQLFQQAADTAHHIDVLLFVMAADVVGLAYHAFGHDLEQGSCVVLHIQPVTYLQAVAVDRQRLAREGIEDHQWDQFLGEVEWTVVIGAVGDQHRQAIGTLPGADQVVGCSLARGVRRAGSVGRGLGEQVVDAMQVAIDLVSGDMVEAEGGFFRLGQLLPVSARRFQQAVGANDIGLDEVRWPIDGAIYMGFGRQVHDRMGLEACQDCADGGLVDDIGLDEFVAAVAGDAMQRLQVACVGQFVQVQHLVFRVLNQVTDQSRADKTGSAGDENAHVRWPVSFKEIIYCKNAA